MDKEQNDIDEAPEPPTDEELLVSVPGYAVDDSEKLSFAPTEDEADASRADWQDSHAESGVQEADQLAWDFDKSLTNGLDTINAIVGEAHGGLHIVEALRAHGLPEDFMATSITLDALDVTLVQAGLQILGMFLVDYRAEIKAVLDSIPDADPSDEERAVLTTASEAVQNERMAAQLEQLQSMMIGGPAADVPTEDAAPEIEEEPEPVDDNAGYHGFEAGLN